jgi:hypothetical protein
VITLLVFAAALKVARLFSELCDADVFKPIGSRKLPGHVWESHLL